MNNKKSRHKIEYKLFKNWQLWLLIIFFSLILFTVNLIIFQIRRKSGLDSVANLAYFYSFFNEVALFYFNFALLPIFIIIIFIWSNYKLNFAYFRFLDVLKGYFKLFFQIWCYVIFQFLLLSGLYMSSGIELYQYYLQAFLFQIAFIWLMSSLIMLFLVILLILIKKPVIITMIFMCLFIIFSVSLYARTNSGSNLLSVNNQLRPIKEKTFVHKKTINKVKSDLAFYINPLATLKVFFDYTKHHNNFIVEYEVDKFTSPYSFVLLNYRKVNADDFSSSLKCRLLVNKALAKPYYYYEEVTQEYKIDQENLEQFIEIVDCQQLKNDDNIFILDADNSVVPMFNKDIMIITYSVIVWILIIIIFVIYPVKTKISYRRLLKETKKYKEMI